MTFEVVYYPSPNWCDFVVDAIMKESK